MTTDVCTTQTAAQLLGISVTSVQQLVEAGVIEAWKTKGGHRRIPLSAVHAYKALPTEFAGMAVPRDAVSRISSVLIIEDNQMQLDIYASKLAAWDLPVKLKFCVNGYQALIEVASHKPDILLADIMMEGIDGYEVIKTIQGHPQLADMNIAIISSLSAAEIAERGGVPEGVVFFNKPVNYDELRGYLRACCAQKARHSLACQQK